MMKKISAIFLAITLLLAAMSANLAHAQTVDTAFNPNLLITDQSFADSGTFGSAAAIQKFFEEHGSVLSNTSASFIAKLKEDAPATKAALEDPEPNLDHLRTAAELIYDATKKTGLNPQVILVTLQKEQSLITGTFASDSDLQTALNHALGFGCPDSGPCNNIFASFYRQLFGSFDSTGGRYLGAAASLMKSFTYTNSLGLRVGRGPDNGSGSTKLGDTLTLSNTMGSFGGIASSQPVTLSNFATTALYRFTPHVFNGNYNFWKYYTLWFKYPNGTVIRKIGETGLFVIDNGAKSLFSQYVASQRKIKLNQIVDVSQTEFDSYLTNPPLTPFDGTLLKGDTDATVYISENGSKQPISGPIFSQRKFSFKKVVTLPQAEVDSYQTGAYLAPLDETIITGNTDKTVYLIEQGQKRPITSTVFVARKLSFRNLMKLSDGEVAGIATGSFLTPPDAVQIQLAQDSGIYWYKNGQKQFVSAFVYKQRGVGNFQRVILGSDEFNAIPTTNPLPPKDGTIVKGDSSDAIFQVSAGQLHLLTPTSYKRLRNPKPTVLPQTEVDSYSQGDPLLK
jgi:hypothetical protein